MAGTRPRILRRRGRSPRDHREFFSASVAEIAQILLTGDNEWMPFAERLRCDSDGAAEEVFRIDRIAGDLADDPEVVQRIGQLRMEPPEGCFLDAQRLAQQLFGGDVVTRSRGAFPFFDDGAKFPHRALSRWKAGTLAHITCQSNTGPVT